MKYPNPYPVPHLAPPQQSAAILSFRRSLLHIAAALLTCRGGLRLCHRRPMSSHDRADPGLEKKGRHDDSRSAGNSGVWTADDDLHFRDQRDWQDLWMVWQRSVYEHQALAVDSGAASCGDGD